MPSNRPQFNVRPDDATMKLIGELQAVACQKTGIQVSQSDLLRLMAASLAREYGLAPPSAPPAGKQKPGPKSKK